MKKAMTPKKLVHYAIVITVMWLSYRFYVSYQEQQEDRFKPYGPRDIRRGQLHRRDQDVDDMDKAQAVDLDRRLHELEKELERQKLLNNQQQKHVKNDRHPGNLNAQEGDSNQEDRKYVKKGEQHQGEEKKEEEEQRVKGNPLADADIDVGDSENEDKRIDGNVSRNQERVVRFEKGDKRQPLVGDRPKEVRRVERDGPPRPKNSHREAFQIEPKIDWALEEELQGRRKKYLEQVAQLADEYDPTDYKDMLERDDDLAFVTAASDRNWGGLLQFIYSIQYFYPNSDIGIFDLGLSVKNKQTLETFCKVTVHMMFLNLWPDHLKDLTKNLWRPMVWQMALASYGHMVYMEPDRFLYAKNMKNYFEHSLRAGITVVGRKLRYSPFVVTHPEMYYFFSVDTRKLQRVDMFDFTMLIMHNSQPIRHEFMRHLVSCTMEEYCISPPGARSNCDHRLYTGSTKYANCHRYEMSAVNILLDKWFQYKVEAFLVRDIATRHYDGTDVRAKIKVCLEPKPAEKTHKEEI